MEALQTILTRRSTRKFLQKEVEEDLLNQIIEAGRHAPTGGNSQSAELLIITRRDLLNQLALQAKESFSKMEIYEGMYRSKKNAIMASKNGNYIFHYNAPVVIVLTNLKSYSNNMADCSCIAENMMIAANALDLGACWINQLHWLSDDPDIREILKPYGLSDDRTICCCLALGYPDTEDKLPLRQPKNLTGNKVTFIK